MQANGVTTLNQLRDVLIAMLEGGAGPLVNTQPTVDHPGREQAYVDTYSLGAERELWPGISLAVDLLRSEGRDILVTADLNPSSTAAGGRPDLSVLDGQPVRMGSITTFVNAGETDYTSVQLSLRKRFQNGLGGRAATWRRPAPTRRDPVRRRPDGALRRQAARRREPGFQPLRPDAALHDPAAAPRRADPGGRRLQPVRRDQLRQPRQRPRRHQHLPDPDDGVQPAGGAARRAVDVLRSAFPTGSAM